MSKAIEQVVREKYGAVAAGGLSTDHAGVKAVAEAYERAYEVATSSPRPVSPIS